MGGWEAEPPRSHLNLTTPLSWLKYGPHLIFDNWNTGYLSTPHDVGTQQSSHMRLPGKTDYDEFINKYSLIRYRVVRFIWVNASSMKRVCVLFVQFSYVASTPQLQFLQILSSKAQQNITYHCKNTVAYLDAATKSNKKAIVFASSDDHELGATKSRFRYNVPLDECKVGFQSGSVHDPLAAAMSR